MTAHNERDKNFDSFKLLQIMDINTTIDTRENKAKLFHDTVNTLNNKQK